MLRVVYSKKYLKYHFEAGHPFWPERAKEFLSLLEKKDFDYEIVDAPRASDEEILLVHTKNYLKRVKRLAEEKGYLSVDTQVNADNLEAAYYSVGGTIKAAEIALEGGLAVNTLGGLHHAETNDSSGFCIFNDHSIAIRRLQASNRSNSKSEIRSPKQIPNTNDQNSKHRIKKACVLDLDVHAGNGTQEIFYSDPSVLTVSIHQDPSFFYPGTGFKEQEGEGEGKGYNINYPLPSGTTEDGYLPVLDEAIGEVKKFRPDILFVVFGADTYKDDPLAGFRLEKKTYGKIALRLTSLAQDRPMVVLFAGGYSKDVPEIWWELIKGLV